jgi:hypothetical protein
MVQRRRRFLVQTHDEHERQLGDKALPHDAPFLTVNGLLHGKMCPIGQHFSRINVPIGLV